ncbi:aminotransferase class III-fold pyridoxal phosphate-dependent enzyme [Thalassotalea castellviae]|uniref:Aminotransferase class III-fold pyridoxal phosphate-dependent enzyme n=1 Tax=Thalassotalea castellviae TaxID=3075612 RepID=A0ABU2ZY56_9GAMM|nr:aminotransferase class III-fold pyridoxal phosphate-dependent enzyme [Thalassotalea sp. W431]MDT0602858.1 aminotransferase class III-fold pyridoxal phosphate-dependent enzyme [Thalassotalea sp. W431]
MNKKTFQQSLTFLNRAEKSIPLGSQTFSKSKVAFPKGVTPLFINQGKGCQVWDLDGNQFTDYVSGLLAVSIGYCDNDIDQAVIEQLKSGVSFSLPHQLETEVAELIIDSVPCAEMVRFGKNGTDATSAAIRLARAYNHKEHIAVCGYHGWQDWYIGSTTRDLGVPQSTKALTHKFEYNNIASLTAIFEQFPDQISAVMLEPMNIAYPEKDFLEQVKTLCQQHNAVLIFDETITGFRFSIGGAQQLFGVTPDLATFGKGMANGYPISAVVGKREIMTLMEDIFFSGTFAGETLSLAASKAVLTKMKNEKVLSHIHAMGELLHTQLQATIDQYQAHKWLSISGHPSWLFFMIKSCGGYSDLQLKSYFIQEMIQQGILINASHNLSYAHKEKDIQLLVSAYKHVIPLVNDMIKQQDFDQRFHGEVLQPVFKVR